MKLLWLKNIYDFLAGELRRWKHQQPEDEKLTLKKFFPVCTQIDGRMILKTHLERILQRENLNAHSFRHTYATTLTENGATPKGVTGRLGHSSTTITQNLYTHNTQKLQKDTASIFTKTCRQILLNCFIEKKFMKTKIA